MFAATLYILKVDSTLELSQETSELPRNLDYYVQVLQAKKF